MHIQRRVRRRVPGARPAITQERLEMLVTDAALLLEASHAAAVLAKDALGALHRAMDEAKVTSCRSGPWAGEIVQSPGRTSNTIDPAGFRKLVRDDKEFYSAVTISITEAKKVLPQKSLDKIITSVTGTPGVPTLKVSKVK